jgi:hypothetical protein
MSFTRVLLPQTVNSLRDAVQPSWLLVAKSLLLQWAVGLLCVERLFLVGFSLLDENGLWTSFRRATVLLAFVMGSIGLAIGELSRLRDVIHSRTSLWAMAAGYRRLCHLAMRFPRIPVSHSQYRTLRLVIRRDGNCRPDMFWNDVCGDSAKKLVSTASVHPIRLLDASAGTHVRIGGAQFGAYQ